MEGKHGEVIALNILKNVSAGLAVFNLSNLTMRWCNASFKKQTWFGGAQGGKNAPTVTVFDLFDKRDHAAILELLNITERMGRAYDFQRMVRRGPVGSFPAELKLHKLQGQPEENLVCLEIQDLSLSKLYDELESAHSQMRDRMADLMAAQAELHFSVRMNTISEIGADVAHQLINPVTMCKDILESQVLPSIENPAATREIHQALRYLKDIQDLAVWFRKFSNPRLSETQICGVNQMVEDALTLNMHRFSKLGITAKVRKREDFNPFVLAIPINIIMWLNAAFSEFGAYYPGDGSNIYIDINGNEEAVQLAVHASTLATSSAQVTTSTLEKFAKRLPGLAKFECRLSDGYLTFSLSMACFSETESEDVPNSHSVSLHILPLPERKGDNRTALGEEANSAKLSPENLAVRPVVLFVDDEQDIRRLLRRTFKNLGLESFEASDGIEALEIFNAPEHRTLAKRIRVVVSDVRMPRMTGPHLLVALRELKVELPFVFFSSNLVDSGSQSTFKDDKVFYLTKESGMDDLKALVLKYMSLSESTDPAPATLEE